MNDFSSAFFCSAAIGNARSAAIHSDNNITIFFIVFSLVVEIIEARFLLMPNVEVTGAARLYRAASSDRRERGRPPGYV